MRVVSLTAIFAFAMSIVTPALAWGPVGSLGAPSSVEQAKAKYKWMSGGCKYEYKSDEKGFSEKCKCK
jgi:hypothetical protein